MIAGSKPLHAALLLILLSGCGYEGPELAGIPGLQTKVRAYYRDHATEKNGSCRAPEMRGITQVDILEDNDDEMSIRVRYYFRDDEFGDIDDRPWRLFDRCTGFASREFTVGKRDENTIVTGMTGEFRKTRDWSR
ncbi:MAG: hypothetical protein KDH19_02975 [Geminicoccaceae bacterium]|nr:hypothetical protein [Geminicoccaceae bacterium]